MPMDGVSRPGPGSREPATAKRQARPNHGPDAGRFRAALLRAQPDGGPTYSTNLHAYWFRAEHPAPRAATAPPAGAPRQMVDRLLVGESPRGPEARLRISAGALAGTEIHLTAAAGAVEVRLLTAAEGSRQTLAVAMEAIRERLRARGIVLAIAPPGSTFAERRPAGGGGGRR